MWIQTYSGVKFDFDNFTDDDLKLDDIAHALGLLCRFRGHSSMFYSISEHSVRVSKVAEALGGLGAGQWGLLHDAAEVYVGRYPGGSTSAKPKRAKKLRSQGLKDSEIWGIAQDRTTLRQRLAGWHCQRKPDRGGCGEVDRYYRPVSQDRVKGWLNVCYPVLQKSLVFQRIPATSARPFYAPASIAGGLSTRSRETGYH